MLINSQAAPGRNIENIMSLECVPTIRQEGVSVVIPRIADVRIENMKLSCFFGCIGDGLAGKGIHRRVDQTVKRQNRGVRIRHKAIIHMKALAVKIFDQK